MTPICVEERGGPSVIGETFLNRIVKPILSMRIANREGRRETKERAAPCDVLVVREDKGQVELERRCKDKPGLSRG
jgi:hypothetical protein